jgi:hypothetical protein
MRRPACHLALLGTLGLLSIVPSVQAATINPGPPRWVITSVSGPTNFLPESSSDQYVVTATNVGGVSTNSPVTIKDTLPAEGVEVTKVVGAPEGEKGNGEAFRRKALECPTKPPLGTVITCTYPGVVAPGDTLRFTVLLKVSAKEGAKLENRAAVSGGGGEPASTSEITNVSTEKVGFGVANFFTASSTAQAGAYPNFTTSFTLNRGEAEEPKGNPRDIHAELPPGLTGNPLAVPRCNIDYVRRRLCPENTAVGVATAHTNKTRFVVLVYNVTPYPEEPAAFAFSLDAGLGTARLDTSVIPNSNKEYAVHVTVSEVNQSEPVLESSVTLWGVPAEFNGPGPDQAELNVREETVTFGGPGSEAPLAKPFMRNPTACGESPLSSVIETDSWQEPGRVEADGAPELADEHWKTAKSQIPAPVSPEPFTECSLLAPDFTPGIEVSPDTLQAGAPAGYSVNLTVPQSATAERLATPDLKDVSVTLPEGTVASPSAANGLEACSDAQFGQLSVEPASCPRGSQIGTVEIESPLLLEPLKGEVFLGQPECSPCGSGEAAAGNMVRLFLQAQNSPKTITGVRVKLAGRTKINQGTGQLTTVFEANPQQPVGKVRLKLENGPGAPLANPTSCGTATATSKLSPWSGGPPAEPTSSFTISFDGAGAGCPSPRPFAPSFNAQTSNPAAGGYSPFSVTFARSDSQQRLAGITVQTPPGLSGMVSHVTLCPEPQANAGQCSQASEIGTVTAGVGPGPNPFYVTGGKVYMTGPYGGGPYGLSIVVPAVAGPFNLGYEVTRAAIFVDPHTAALTVVGSLPQIRDGIPFQVKTVNVDINRPQFVFNPTNCSAKSVTATLAGTEGGAAAVSSPFAAGGCARLGFTPSFKVSTQGSTSKANGASLDVQVTQMPGQANIQKVDTQLPVELPSRLTTIQQACTDSQFAANPAGCPAGSVVGMATAHTPVLNSPLTGPAYLVSHASAAFPDLVVVLQGEGVRIDLTGNTDIKKGITYSRFETVPDAPVSSFELSLPEGPHSALGALGNLCGENLVMPTTIVGQNGAQITQNTKIAVTGCAKPKISFKIKKARVKGNAVLITLTTTQSGTVTVAGSGLKTTRKKLGAGTHLIVVPLTRAGRGARKHHRSTRIKISAKSMDGSASKTATMGLKL